MRRPMSDGSDYTIGRFQAADRAAWDGLWAEYLTFYRTELHPEVNERTWRRILFADRLFAFGAWTPDCKPAALVHYLVHPTTWTRDDVCYLEDLFVTPSERRRGLARRLIETVAADARARHAEKLYWLTHESNAAGRSLYDGVAHFNGFIRYDFLLRTD